MSLTTLLLYCDDDADWEARSRVALSLARRFRAHLQVVSVEPDATQIPNMYGRTGYLGQEVELTRQRLRLAEEAMKEECCRDGIRCSWYWEEGGALECLTRHSFHADLAIVSQTPANTIEDALFDFMPDHLAITGSCPVLILPKGFSGEFSMNHPLVAWKNRREAALAVRGAIPLLRNAAQVRILSINPKSGEELLAQSLIQWLESHNVMNASFQVRAYEEISPYEIVLDTLAKLECDYLVMGGYSQSQLKQWILGGFTRSFLDKMPVPILMGH